MPASCSVSRPARGVAWLCWWWQTWCWQDPSRRSGSGPVPPWVRRQVLTMATCVSLRWRQSHQRRSPPRLRPTTPRRRCQPQRLVRLPARPTKTPRGLQSRSRPQFNLRPARPAAPRRTSRRHLRQLPCPWPHQQRRLHRRPRPQRQQQQRLRQPYPFPPPLPHPKARSCRRVHRPQPKLAFGTLPLPHGHAKPIRNGQGWTRRPPRRTGSSLLPLPLHHRCP